MHSKLQLVSIFNVCFYVIVSSDHVYHLLYINWTLLSHREINTHREINHEFLFAVANKIWNYMINRVKLCWYYKNQLESNIWSTFRMLSNRCMHTAQFKRLGQTYNNKATIYKTTANENSCWFLCVYVYVCFWSLDKVRVHQKAICSAIFGMNCCEFWYQTILTRFFICRTSKLNHVLLIDTIRHRACEHATRYVTQLIIPS